MYELYFSSLSISLLIGLSAYGSSIAISSACTSSVLYSNKRSMVTRIYIAILMASTIFMYTLMICIKVINDIKRGVNTETAFKHVTACIIYGVCSLAAGFAFDGVYKAGFPLLAKQPTFFLSFILMASTVEVMLIMGMVIAFATLSQ